MSKIINSLPSREASSQTGLRNEQGYFGVAAILNVVFGIILSLLALRFLFTLLGANPSNQFAGLVYNLSQPLVAPFFGLFNYQPQLEAAHLEVATIVALVVYGLVAGFLTRVLFAGRHRV